jgi:hypothetical protein
MVALHLKQHRVKRRPLHKAYHITTQGMHRHGRRNVVWPGAALIGFKGLNSFQMLVPELRGWRLLVTWASRTIRAGPSLVRRHHWGTVNAPAQIRLSQSAPRNPSTYYSALSACLCACLRLYRCILCPFCISLRNASSRIQQPGTHKPGHPDPAATHCASDCASHPAQHIYQVDSPLTGLPYTLATMKYMLSTFAAAQLVSSAAALTLAPRDVSCLGCPRNVAKRTILPPGGLTRDSPSAPAPCSTVESRK